MSAYESLLRKILFRMDAESAHNLGLAAVARGLVRTKLVNDPRLRTEAMGIDFANPIGLAAGMDKNAVAVNHWHQLGFGFAEIGTITRHGQPGNPKPRLFRIPEERAVVNRMGFNNQGAAAVAARLAHSSPKIPLGINLGKSKITPLDEAGADYAASFAELKQFASYVVINVSSPNTPGLRELQQLESLRTILDAMAPAESDPPILIKIAPDLDDADLIEIAHMTAELPVAGLIATNTTIDKAVLKRDWNEAGGISGAPLKTRANDVLRLLRAELPAGKVLIGVGGVFNGSDVIEKLRLGADLVQIYTGWVYGGPSTVPKMLLELLSECDKLGLKSIKELQPKR